MDRLGSTNLRSAPEVVWERGSGLRKEGFDSGPIDKVHKLVDVATTVGQEVGIVGVFIDVESEDGSHTPNGIAVLGVPNVVKQLFRAVIVASPGPATGGDPGRLQIFLKVVKGAEVLIDMFEDTIGRFSISAEDGEVKFVVLQSADGEGEIDLKGSDTGKDLIGDGGISGVGCAHFFELGEDGVTFVDVAGVELEVLFVGFIGNLAGFSLHFSDEGFLLVGVGMGHRRTIPQRRSGVKPEKGFLCGGCRGRLAKLEA